MMMKIVGMEWMREHERIVMMEIVMMKWMCEDERVGQLRGVYHETVSRGIG